MANVSLEGLLLWAVILAGFALTRLPYEELPGGGGGQVPSVLFRGQPAAFYTLVLALILSGSAAAGAVMHRRNFAGYARLCRRTSVASMVVGLGAFLWAYSRSALASLQLETAKTAVADG